MSTSAIERAVGLLGGQTKTANLLGPPVKQGHVYQWIRRGRPPYDYCAAIENLADGKVTCEELCPDVEWVRVGGRVTHYQVRVRPQHQEAA